MLKKLILFTLVFALLAPISPVLAAENYAITQSAEDILNEYLQKIIKQKMNTAFGSVATYSDSFDNNTSAQETIKQLTSAGYEAYHVTPSNYQSIEAALHTDLSSLGLNEDDSYILTFNNIDSYIIDPGGIGNSGDQSFVEGGGSGSTPNSSFSYVYNGEQYTMRQITVSYDSSPDMCDFSNYTISDISRLAGRTDDIISYLACAAIDEITSEVGPIASIGSLLLDLLTDDSHTHSTEYALSLFSSTLWTWDCIQVFSDGTWCTVQKSLSAYSSAYCSGYIYDEDRGKIQYTSDEVVKHFYSPKYTQLSLRCFDAAYAFEHGTILFDRTGDIGFYFYNKDNISIKADGSALFYHFDP